MQSASDMLGGLVLITAALSVDAAEGRLPATLPRAARTAVQQKHPQSITSSARNRKDSCSEFRLPIAQARSRKATAK
jgi:hypothetical protein